MATIKAGTYRFNDVLDYPQGYVSGIFQFTTFPNCIIDYNSKTITAIDGSVTWNRLDCNEDGTMLFLSMEDPGFISAGWLRVNTTPSWGNVYLEMGGAVSADQTFVDGLKTITIPDDTEVADEFYAWFTANAVEVVEETPVASITHNGEAIASLFAGQTATLKCAGMKMAGDVVVAVVENIGGGGECSGNHIIEVDTLPTENIDENAVYLCGGAYYKSVYALADAVLVMGGTAQSVNDMISQGMSVSLNTIPTKTTDGILASDVKAGIFHFYYIEDENDIFIYAPIWCPCSLIFKVPYGGIIADISEATADGYYTLMDDIFIKYFVPTGTLTITENGTHDVSAYAKATVDVPVLDDYIPDGYIKPTGTLTITENGTHDVSGYASAEVNVPGEVLDEYDGTITIL